MKVKVRHEPSRVKLLIDEKGLEGRVLAVLDRFWGSPVWVLQEIRLHPHVREPAEWFGGSADDFWASYAANGVDQAQLVRPMLRDFKETARPDGGFDFEWCTFRGMVSGRRASDMGQPPVNPLDSEICCSRAEGLDKLQVIRDFWLNWSPVEGVGILKQVGSIKLENPLLQPTASQVSLAISLSERSHERPRQ